MSHTNSVKVFYVDSRSQYYDFNLNYDINKWAIDNDVEIVSVNITQGRGYKVPGKLSIQYDILATVVFKMPTSGYVIPSNVININFSEKTKNSVKLFWDHPPINSNQREIDFYAIYYKDETIPSNPFLFAGKTSKKEFKIEKLQDNTSYSFRIVPFDQLMVSPSSFLNFNIFLADSEQPTTPINLSAGYILSNSLVLSWIASTDSNSGIRHYEIYQDGNKIGITKNTSFKVESLNKETSYTFSVKAVDFNGNISSSSNQVTVSTIS